MSDTEVRGGSEVHTPRSSRPRSQAFDQWLSMTEDDVGRWPSLVNVSIATLTCPVFYSLHSVSSVRSICCGCLVLGALGRQGPVQAPLSPQS